MNPYDGLSDAETTAALERDIKLSLLTAEEKRLLTVLFERGVISRHELHESLKLRLR